MAEKKLPIGVGKKIVEALKKQSEIDAQISAETFSADTEENQNEELVQNYTSFNENSEMTIADEINDLDLNEIENAAQNIINEPINFKEPHAPAIEPSINFEPKNNFEPTPNLYDQTNAQFQNFAQNNYAQPVQDSRIANNYGERIMTGDNGVKTYAIPANVAVLKKLITQLPAGVTKQTGAQIIRQTMEALGISMNSLLTEAQRYQDDLNNSIKDCMNTVNEYKQNIMTLEKQVIDYQKQAKSFNDLISLFILTDK